MYAIAEEVECRTRLGAQALTVEAAFLDAVLDTCIDAELPRNNVQGGSVRRRVPTCIVRGVDDATSGAIKLGEEGLRRRRGRRCWRGHDRRRGRIVALSA